MQKLQLKKNRLKTITKKSWFILGLDTERACKEEQMWSGCCDALLVTLVDDLRDVGDGENGADGGSKEDVKAEDPVSRFGNGGLPD